MDNIGVRYPVRRGSEFGIEKLYTITKGDQEFEIPEIPSMKAKESVLNISRFIKFNFPNSAFIEQDLSKEIFQVIKNYEYSLWEDVISVIINKDREDNFNVYVVTDKCYEVMNDSGDIVDQYKDDVDGDLYHFDELSRKLVRDEDERNRDLKASLKNPIKNNYENERLTYKLPVEGTRKYLQVRVMVNEMADEKKESMGIKVNRQIPNFLW